MQGHHWLGVRPRSHHFLYFVLGHLVISQRCVVAEHASAQLVGDADREDGPPSNAEDHVEGDAQRLDPSQLVMSGQIVD